MKRCFLEYLSLTLLLILMFTGEMSAQKRGGDIYVIATYETELKEGNRENVGIVFKQGKQKYIYGLDDAVVVLRHNTDTLKCLLTGVDGRCVFKDIPYGNYHISISYVGYNQFEADFNHSSKKSNIEAPMVESSFILDMVKVKGNIPLTIFRGDTVIVNPLAVQTKQGAAAIEIIKQVPGVEISKSGTIMAFGKILQRSYVGGNSLFGSNVLAALQGVDADLVKNIKFYDEYERVATINGEHITQAVRVMNIETTRELLSSANGHLLVGAGRDIKDDGVDEKGRYKGGLSLNMYNKGLIINTNIYKNNVGLSRNKADYLSNLMSGRTTGDKTIGYADIKIERNNGEPRDAVYSLLRVNYKYKNDNTRSELREERMYYDTEYYSDRKYESLSVKDIEQQSHDFSITFRKNYKEKKLKSYSLGHSMRFDNNNNLSNVWQNELSDLTNITLEDISNQRIRNWSVTENASCNFWSNELSLNGSLTIGEGDGTGIRSVKESGMERIYEFTPIGENIKASGRASVRVFGWSNSGYYGILRLNLATSCNKEKKQEFRYDLGEETYLDSLNSYYYSTNNFENSVELYLDYSRKGNGWRKGITAVLGLKQVSITDDDRLYSIGQVKRYYTPTIQIDCGYGYVFRALYRLNPSVPALEQLRNRVDDTNPLYLRVGNPKLKLAQKHYVSLSSSTSDPFSPSSCLQMTLEGCLDQNVVVPYTEYYPLGGKLAQCGNYPVMSGATVQSYRNVRNEYETKISANYSARLRSIKTKVSASVYGQYNKNYSYVQGEENCTDRYSAYIRLLSETSYKRVSFSLMTKSEYVFSSNSVREDYKYFNQRIGANMDLTLFKYWFVNSSYDLHFNMPVDGTRGVINRDNILNVSTGANLLKSRLKIGFSVFDIFNSSSSFKTMQYADYVQNNWTRMFGRYYSVDIFFNLRKHKFSK